MTRRGWLIGFSAILDPAAVAELELVPFGTTAGRRRERPIGAHCYTGRGRKAIAAGERAGVWRPDVEELVRIARATAPPAPGPERPAAPVRRPGLTPRQALERAGRLVHFGRPIWPMGR